jgi:hypothetical protein
MSTYRDATANNVFKKWNALYSTVQYTHVTVNSASNSISYLKMGQSTFVNRYYQKLESKYLIFRDLLFFSENYILALILNRN